VNSQRGGGGGGGGGGGDRLEVGGGGGLACGVVGGGGGWGGVSWVGLGLGLCVGGGSRELWCVGGEDLVLVRGRIGVAVWGAELWWLVVSWGLGGVVTVVRRWGGGVRVGGWGGGGGDWGFVVGRGGGGEGSGCVFGRWGFFWWLVEYFCRLILFGE